MRGPRRDSRWSTGRLLRRDRYATYIASPDWYRRRERWYIEHFAQTGALPVCAVCGRLWSLRDGELHHRAYERLGHERHHDLVPLCRAHHQALHELWDALPTWRKLGRTHATTGIIAALRHNERGRQK